MVSVGHDSFQLFWDSWLQAAGTNLCFLIGVSLNVEFASFAGMNVVEGGVSTLLAAQVMPQKRFLQNALAL